MLARFSPLLVVVLAMAGTTPALFAQATQPIDLRILAIEGTDDVQGPAALAERKVVVQIQDVSRGPLSGAEVTFTLPENGDAGFFANSSRVEKLVTDRDGLVTVQIRPLKRKFTFRIDAFYQARTARSIISVGGATGPSLKRILIVGAIGAAAVVGALVATGGQDASASGPTITTINVGTPAVGPPQ